MIAIALHGLTDIDSPTFILPYLFMTFIPLLSSHVTICFCVASLAHFSLDFGIVPSLCVHLFVAWYGIEKKSTQAAFKAMIVYLALFHVPMHYIRCLAMGRVVMPFVTALITACGIANRDIVIGSDWVALTDNSQRLVIAHVITEALNLLRFQRSLKV